MSDFRSSDILVHGNSSWNYTDNHALPNLKMGDVKDAIALLSPYSSCDISDALCALPDLNALGNIPVSITNRRKIIGPAYTAEFVFSSSSRPKAKEHHVDSCPAGSVLVIKAPAEAPNAVWGGLMTARALQVGCIGAVVYGNMRDHDEIAGFEFPVWYRGKSTMGAKPFCKLASVGEPVVLNASSAWPVYVETGDLIIADVDGVVRVPVQCAKKISDYCARRVAIDQKCMEEIQNGLSIAEAFAKHRN